MLVLCIEIFIGVFYRFTTLQVSPETDMSTAISCGNAHFGRMESYGGDRKGTGIPEE